MTVFASKPCNPCDANQRVVVGARNELTHNLVNLGSCRDEMSRSGQTYSRHDCGSIDRFRSSHERRYCRHLESHQGIARLESVRMPTSQTWTKRAAKADTRECGGCSADQIEKMKGFGGKSRSASTRHRQFGRLSQRETNVADAEDRERIQMSTLRV